MPATFKRISAVFAVFIFAIAVQAVVTAPALAVNLNSLGDNTWVKAIPTYLPGGRDVEARSYSGSAWSEKDGLFVTFGGAHGSYLGNDVDEYNPLTDTWTQVYTPEFPTSNGSGSTSTDPYTALVMGTLPQAGTANADSPTGKPWSAHTYQAMAVDNNGVMLYMDLRYSTWTYMVKTGTWTRMTPSSTPSAWDSLGHAMVYASDTDEFILFAPTWTWSYKYTGDKSAPWTRIYGTQPPGTIHHAMAYDPTSNKVVLFGGEVYSGGSPVPQNQTWTFDTVTRQWTRMYPSGQIPPARSAHGMAYDAVNDVVVLYGGRTLNGSGNWTCLGDMYVYHVSTNTWEKVAAPATNPGNTCLVFGSFAYAPKYNSFVLLTAPNGMNRPSGDESYRPTETWLYRYKNGSISTDTLAPSPPPSLAVK